jgi:hypothetical protein
MINKNNICVIIGSYPTTYLDNSLLGLTIESWKQQGYDICLVSHTPLNTDIQKAAKYSIYTDENDILKFDNFSDITWYYSCPEFLYQSNWGNTIGKHSFAVLKNIQNALYFLKSKQYTHFIYADSDSFLNIDEHSFLENNLAETDFLNKNTWFMTEYSGNVFLPASSMFAGSIDYFYSKIESFQTPQDYLKYCGTGYSLESFISKLFFENGPTDTDIIIPQPARQIFTNPWYGISSNGSNLVPGLKHKDWWLDFVRDDKDNSIIYLIITNSNYQFNTTIKLFKDNQLATEFDHTTGPFLWIRLDMGETKEWRAENWIGNEKIKEISLTTDNIKNNTYSFLSLAN